MPLKQPPPKKKPILPAAQVQIEEGHVLAEKLRLHNWDYIIAGDGSGTKWSTPVGFGSVLYRNRDGYRKKFFGGFSNGTNNVAEMMAVVLPLLYIEGTVNPNPQGKLLNVYIISDSSYVVNGGNGDAARKSNQTLWAVIDKAKTKMNLIFIHVNRNVLPANKFGDKIAGHIRKQLTEIVAKLSRRSLMPKKPCSQQQNKPSK